MCTTTNASAVVSGGGLGDTPTGGAKGRSMFIIGRPDYKGPRRTARNQR
jgi:hypothetical protein